jgi:hypothetical protein
MLYNEFILNSDDKEIKLCIDMVLAQYLNTVTQPIYDAPAVTEEKRVKISDYYDYECKVFSF